MASDACSSSTRQSRGGDGGRHELKVGYATSCSLQSGNVKDGKLAILHVYVKQTHCKFFVWVDDHIVRLGCVEPTRALGDNQPNDVEEHLRKKEMEHMMADLEETIVNLENRRSNTCCEEGLKQFSYNATNSNAFSNSPKEVKSSILGCLTTSSGLRKRSTSQHMGSIVKAIWELRSKAVDGGEKENETHVNTDMKLIWFSNENKVAEKGKNIVVCEDSKSKIPNDFGSKDMILAKKVDALTKAMEVELKKMKREAATREKEASSTKSDKKKTRSTSTFKRVMKDH
ncbi:hypothetical protein Ahy_A02g007530 [Arachis hypogaea]|uniref:Uncharacterized protein n=1 Tax=Arachis hypogaea TaxID=3818 RepID=A0A445ECI7_ARAHY|nr:hypothetical protein Ahy_A02g007530 [Arachis hypogaea]